jgi:hypothetical protein
MRSNLGATVAFGIKATECDVANGVAIVVDDDEALRVILKQLLESVGLRCCSINRQLSCWRAPFPTQRVAW